MKAADDHCKNEGMKEYERSDKKQRPKDNKERKRAKQRQRSHFIWHHKAITKHSVALVVGFDLSGKQEKETGSSW